ncbi:MAG: hypothetical protein JXB15_11380 [Anaerolineales bacterium]|nr:hypothetical protein [Anaerolineales bacterium]
MSNPNLEDTQPLRPKPAPPPAPAGKPGTPQKSTPQPKSRRWLWAAAILLALLVVLVFSASAGYRSGKQSFLAQSTSQSRLTLEEQYLLALQDYETGQYEVALQRFKYILEIDPSYPGVTDKLAEVMAVLYVTATPSPLPATSMPTPTRDLRPVEDLFKSAQDAIANQNWEQAIDTLISLRQADPNYRMTRVDGWLYLSLRNRGISKITNQANLGGGVYDLSLAERFGPLDVEANTTRDWARMYMYGLSFWEVDPKQAVFYFGQVAAALPYLRDASGWTAVDRYRASLLQYGDILIGQKAWCEAMTQYELALGIRPDAALQETLIQLTGLCLGSTETPAVSGTPTETPTPTLPGQPSDTPTITTNPPTETVTSQPPTTTTEPPTEAPPTETPTSTPTDTEAPPPTDAYPAPSPISPSGLSSDASPIGANWALPIAASLQGFWAALRQALEGWL